VFILFRQLLLDDIVTLIQSQVISEDTGLSLENVTLSQLGKARLVFTIKVTQIYAKIVKEGTEGFVFPYYENLRKQIKLSYDSYLIKQLQDRIANFFRGVGVIKAKVSAVLETEMKDKKLRLEDIIGCIFMALEEGIVLVGSTMFIYLLEHLKQWSKLNLREDELIGALILSKSITLSLKRMNK
jgi:chaperonin GroEL